MDTPVLVTGLGRSGTTWLGNTLSLSGELHYVHEPAGTHSSSLKWPLRLPVGRSPYFCRDNEEKALKPLTDVFQLNYPLANGLRQVRSPADLNLVIRQFRDANRARRRGIPPLIKDPGLFFSAPWITERFGPRMIIIVRHPAAVISSIKRQGWKPNFRNWLDQPLLLRDHLGACEAKLRERLLAERDPIEDGILLWNIYNATAQKFRELYPSWVFVRHEDLAAEPIARFRDLYERLGLRWSQTVQDKIEMMTGAGNPQEDPLRQIWTTTRDSRATTTTWRSRLTTSEIERIKTGVAEVSGWFYGEEDWLDNADLNQQF